MLVKIAANGQMVWNMVRDHSFSTFVKLSEKLRLLTPWQTHVCVSG